MIDLKKVNITEIARKLHQPFSMVNVATVGDLVVSLYICQGVLDWHRHLDNDELFWVHQGTMFLDSEWGTLQLQPGELTVVPKGVEHRSRAGARADVLLLRCGFVADRKNGNRRLYGLPGEAKLQHVSLIKTARSLVKPFRFQTVARIAGAVVQVAWGEGTWSLPTPAPHDVSFLILEGTATVRASRSMVHLHPGDLTVAPRDVVYHLSTTKNTLLAQVTREGQQGK
ncbi:MAG TPA: cupin domain-containing protein [Chloroflexi bacterium]|nr:cupin domain-containing protein [Chloroflexota bacterium]